MRLSEMTDEELTDYAVLLLAKLPFPKDMELWEKQYLIDLIGNVEWEIYRRGI
jgi:hypothetical protein